MSYISHQKLRQKAQRQSGVRIRVTDFWHWGKTSTNICGICGEVILTYADASVDHIVPLADGGTETFENTRLAHIKCNTGQHHADKMYRDQAAVRARGGQDGSIPHASVRKQRKWRNDRANICAVCNGVIPTAAVANVRYRIPPDQGGDMSSSNLELVHWYCQEG